MGPITWFLAPLALFVAAGAVLPQGLAALAAAALAVAGAWRANGRLAEAEAEGRLRVLDRIRTALGDCGSQAPALPVDPRSAGEEELAACVAHLAAEHRSALPLVAAMNALPDGVITVDRQGRVTFYNPAAAALMVSPPQGVVGRPVVEAIRSYPLVQAIDETLSSGQAWRGEIVLGTGEGRSFTVLVHPIGETEVQGAVALLHDSTELRRLERLRTDFVANVSHELRTPLTSIKGFVETLLEGKVRDEETKKRFLHTIARETDRLVSLVRDLLELSRLESNAPLPEFSPVDLSATVRHAVVLLKDLAESKGVEVHTELEQGMAVPADPDLLLQLVLNLLENAIRYTPQGGRVELTVAPASDGVGLVVRDTGIGIPAADLPRIFERFYRVDKARSRREGGTGLGLAIVKHIAHRHRAHIEVESQVGVGTTFRLTFPRYQAAASPTPGLTGSENAAG